MFSDWVSMLDVDVNVGHGTTLMIVLRSCLRSCCWLSCTSASGIPYCAFGRSLSLSSGRPAQGGKAGQGGGAGDGEVQREADNSQRKAEQETARLQIELAAKETARWQREADETHNDKLVAVVREGSRIEREASQRASDALVSAIQQASATISDVKGEIVALNAKVSKITSPLAPRTNAVANISDAITPIGLGGVRFLFVSTCVSGRWGGARGRLARAGRGWGGAGHG
jgi:hypothetical protein